MSLIIKRYIGIDFGTKRIGLALGDSGSRMAIPIGVVSDLSQVLDLIREEDVDEIVIGIPFTMKSESGPMQKTVEKFINEIKEKTGLPIIEIDERLSSKGADALFGHKKDKADRDALAAMIILQSYLDKV